MTDESPFQADQHIRFVPSEENTGCASVTYDGRSLPLIDENGFPFKPETGQQFTIDPETGICEPRSKND